MSSSSLSLYGPASTGSPPNGQPPPTGSRLLTQRRRRVVDLAALAVLYAAYTASRNAVAATRATAVRNARSVLTVERWAHLDPERGANHVVASHPLLAQLCDYDYAIAHFAVTVPVMLWLYSRRGTHARRLAAVWYVTNLLALAVFFTVPVAPPRLLPHAGFVDTVVAFHTWGSWGTGAVASASNQYAAMPSLHVAWALWSAVAVWSLSRRPTVRVLAVAYPVVTLLVVLGTANHYLLDTAAGAGAVALAYAVVAAAVRLRERAGTARWRWSW